MRTRYIAFYFAFPVVLAVTIVLLALAAHARSAAPTPPKTEVHHAEWSRNAVIYELNTRQFTPEGTFKAVLPRVDELKRLGVGIVWFMPIHPIGQVERKGSLGSPYAVKDYYGVNPEFGTLDDFKAVVNAMHAAGLHVIIDMVLNHTSPDNPIVAQHPDWFVHDAAGKFVPPTGTDWTDVIQLDYSKPALRQYMIGMMEHWVRDVGVDGFRCDVADKVPTSFWDEARPRLDKIKPIFMVAEAQKPELELKAFDSDYAYDQFWAFDKIAHGEANVSALDKLHEQDVETYPRGSWRMNFTTNHDQNSWLDSDIHRLGLAGSKAFSVVVFTLPGKPLIYNGQEVGDRKKLAFFEKDPITWQQEGGGDMRSFYTRLCDLYRSHKALYEGAMVDVHNDHPEQVYSYWRQADGEAPILVVANLSGKKLETLLDIGVHARTVTDLLPAASDEKYETVGSELHLSLSPWEYHVLQIKGDKVQGRYW
jgi:glycosidase